MENGIREKRNPVMVGTRKRSKRKIIKLNEEEVKEIRNLYKTGQYTQQQLSIKFEVSYVTVNNIVNNVTWRNVK